MQRVSCRVTVVRLSPTVLPGSLMKATATCCHWKRQGYCEVDLEDRNAMSWRGREEDDSSDGVHHQCCKRSERWRAPHRRGKLGVIFYYSGE
jgi:hypothetical protein